MPKQINIENRDQMVGLMNLFWIKGYMATSIEDLASQTGTSKSFIYTKYGKKGLFEEAFYFYLKNYTDPFLEALNDDSRGIEAIQEKLSLLGDSLINQTMPKACLFVNTVVEMGDKDRDIGSLNEMYVKRVSEMYSKKLHHCHAIGEIKNSNSIPLYTKMLVSMLFSLAVLYKTRSKEELDTFIASQLQLIR